MSSKNDANMIKRSGSPSLGLPIIFAAALFGPSCLPEFETYDDLRGGGADSGIPGNGGQAGGATTGTGATSASGGALATGGASGASAGTGGSVGNGGSNGSAGTMNSGGTSSSGGAIGRGGRMGTGGADSMGGAPGMEDAGPMMPDAPSGEPSLDPDNWTLSASSSDSPPEDAIDGNAGTRWSSGVEQAGGEFFQIDLGAEFSISTLVLDSTGSPDDFPAGYEVYASNDPNDFGSAIATGAGQTVTTIDVTGTQARYLRIVQTGTSEFWWSIHELSIQP